MRRIVTICLFLISGISIAQEPLSTEQWQEDLKFLQNTVHEHYPFLFKKLSVKEFDSSVEDFYKAIPNLEEHEIRVGFNKIVALFKYGHTQIPFSNVAKKGILPINLYQFSDGIYIEGVQKGYEKILGARLLKIEKTPIEEALKMVAPVVPVENSQYMKAYGIRYLLSPEVLHTQKVIPKLNEKLTLTLEKEGRTFTHTLDLISREEKPRQFNFTIPTESWLTARDTTETPLYLKNMAERYYVFDYLEDSNVLYVRQSSVFNHETETLEDFYKRLFEFIDTHEISKLIYDVRLNGGGNNYNNLNLIKGLMARPKINVRGKFFFIIGRDTFSACQNLTNEILRYTEAILVGEPTAENENFYGDNRPVKLPNSGITAYLSYTWWQDRPQWEGRDATYPHLAAEMSFTDYKSNDDVVLQTALDYKDDGFILDPMKHLTDLFISGNYEQLSKDASKIAQDKRYMYYDFKEEFSQAGGRLQQQGNLQGALFVYQLVAQNYPKDIGAWYSLASVQKELQQKDEAISSYRKIIELDPDHVLANAASKQIDKLQKK